MQTKSSAKSQSQHTNYLKVLDHDPEAPSDGSSAEHLAANTRANQHSSYSTHSTIKNDQHETPTTTNRRPSILLEMQEMISGRRPSAIMASLRRGSQSILAPFRSKHTDDPNDHVGARSPEAQESRRKNRRYGE